MVNIWLLCQSRKEATYSFFLGLGFKLNGLFFLYHVKVLDRSWAHWAILLSFQRGKKGGAEEMEAIGAITVAKGGGTTTIIASPSKPKCLLKGACWTSKAEAAYFTNWWESSIGFWILGGKGVLLLSYLKLSMPTNLLELSDKLELFDSAEPPLPASTIDKSRPDYEISMPRVVFEKWHIHNNRLTN